MRFQEISRNGYFSIRTRLILGGILILMVPMTIVGMTLFVKNSKTLEDISTRELVQISEKLAETMQIAFEKDLRNLNYLAMDQEIIRGVLADEYSHIQKNLTTLYPILSADFEGIAIYDVNGVIRADGVDINRVGISIAERSYFQAAKNGKTGVGPLVSSKATGKLIIGLSAPIVSSEGKFIGGVLGVAKIDYLLTFIRSVTIGQTGFVFMMDQAGTVISHPDEEIILSSTKSKEAGIDSLLQKIAGQKITSVHYSYRGIEKIAGVSPVPLTGWSLGVTQNKDEIMSLAYSNMKFIVLVMAICIFLVIVAVFVFSKAISRPVQETIHTLKHAIDHAEEAFIIIGPDRKVVFVNPAMFSITGLPDSEVTGKVFPPELNTDDIGREIWRTLESGVAWKGDFSGKKQNGDTYTISFTVTPFVVASKDLTYYLAVGRDITEVLEVQEQLKRAQKLEAVGTLSSGIAHDFNNILSAVFGYTDLALHTLGDEKRTEKCLKEIQRASGRARDLIKHIQAIGSGTVLNMEPLIPKYIIMEAVELLRASLPATIDIQTSLKSSAAIKGDKGQIHQIIMNLGSNAGYAMKEVGGTLTLTLDEINMTDSLHPDLQKGEYLQIQVSDTGAGIPPESLERIFDPFYTTKPTGEGSGLGLAMVYGITKSLQGEIRVDSEVGKGTVIAVLLPTIDAGLLSLEERGENDLLGGDEKILLVDDESSITGAIQSLLESLGYSVCSMNQSDAAWETFSENKDNFDIVITDYTMPNMTGIALSEKIRHIRADIPIILCSGNMSIEIEIEYLHPIAFVRKPTAAMDLTVAIRKMLDTDSFEIS